MIQFFKNYLYFISDKFISKDDYNPMILIYNEGYYSMFIDKSNIDSYF